MDNSPELDGHHGAYLNIPLSLDESSVLHLRGEREIYSSQHRGLSRLAVTP